MSQIVHTIYLLLIDTWSETSRNANVSSYFEQHAPKCQASVCAEAALYYGRPRTFLFTLTYVRKKELKGAEAKKTRFPSSCSGKYSNQKRKIAGGRVLCPHTRPTDAVKFEIPLEKFIFYWRCIRYDRIFKHSRRNLFRLFLGFPAFIVVSCCGSNQLQYSVYNYREY